MKTRAALLVLVAPVVLLGSCRTTEPIWFIATPGYVETRIAASEASLRQDYQESVARIERDLAEQRAVSERLASLSELIEALESSDRELRDLAEQVERQLVGLPDEIIGHIIDALTRHIESRAGDQPQPAKP